MSAQGRNEGFFVLDEFICEAIHAPSIARVDPSKQGRNEGMSVVVELIFDAGGEPTSEDEKGSQRTTSPQPVATNNALKSEAERLAAFITASADPTSTMALFQELLRDELADIQRLAAGFRETGRPLDEVSEKPASSEKPS